MTDAGRTLYECPDNYYEESLQFRDINPLGNEPYDVLIVGAGVVGCTLAYKLSQYQLSILLIDKNYDVGEGTSKGSSAIVHTGFDAYSFLRSVLFSRASSNVVFGSSTSWCRVNG